MDQTEALIEVLKTEREAIRRVRDRRAAEQHGEDFVGLERRIGEDRRK